MANEGLAEPPLSPADLLAEAERLRTRLREIEGVLTSAGQAISSAAFLDSHLVQFFDSAPVGVIVLDLNHRHVYMNRRHEASRGYAPGSAIGRTVEEAVPGSTERIVGILDEVARTGQPSTGHELSLPQVDAPHVICHWRVSYFPLRDAAGAMCGIIIFTEDISEQRNAERARQDALRLRSQHLQLTPLAYIRFDMQWSVVEWNPSAERLLGYRKDEAVGQPMLERFVPEAVRSGVRAALERTLEGVGGFQNINEVITKGGDVRLCQWWNTALRDSQGELLGVACLGLDVTDRSTAAEQLRTTNDRLLILNEVTRAVVSSHTPSELADALVHTLRRFIPVDAFFLNAYNDVSCEFRDIGFYDTIGGEFAKTRLNAVPARWERLPFLEKIARGRTPELILRTEEECQVPIHKALAFGDHQRRSASLIFLPLALRDHVIGIISVQSYIVGAYSHETADLLAEVGRCIAPAVETILLHYELENRAREVADSEARVRAILDATHDSVVLLDLSGRILDVNRAFLQFKNLTRDDVLGRVVWPFMAEAYANMVRQRVEAVLAGGTIERFESLVDGRWRDVVVYPIRDTAGKVATVALFASDVTERKRVEHQLRQTNRLLEALNAVSRVVVGPRNPEALSRALADTLRQILPVDAFLLDAFDESRGTVHAIGYYDTINGRFELAESGPHPEDWRTIPHYRTMLFRREPVLIHRKAEELETPPTRGLGFGNESRRSASLLYIPLAIEDHIRGFVSIQSYALNAYRPDDVELMVAIGKLIAPAIEGLLLSKQLDEKMRALATSETQYRTLVENLNVGVFRVEKTGASIRVVNANPAFAHILGYDSPEQLLAVKGDHGHLTPQQRNWVIESIRKEGALHNARLTVRRRDGNFVDVTITAKVHSGDKPGVRYIEGVLEDISSRRKAEEERNRLVTAIEQLAESVEITDPKGTIVYVNPAFEKVTGYSREEIVGRNASTLKSGEHPPEFYGAMWDTLLAGNVWTGRFINRHRSGQLVYEDSTITPVFDMEGGITNFVAVKKDVTQEMQVESRLRQSQKMEAIGLLAGGIAHDFNNILQGILGFADLARSEVQDDSPVHQMLSEIETAGRRAAELVAQILTFSRETELARRPLLLQSIVREALKLLRGTIPTTIEIKEEISRDCGPVLANPTQMHQVLINLATNSYHAMRASGGVLRVALRQLVIEAADARKFPNLKPGPHAALVISDTGSGIPPAIMDRIFEPYFTTKPKGEGTGLGLATVHGIVISHGGDIAVESVLGQGTTFTIYLPVCAIATPDNASTESAPPSVPPNLRVLFVEDEEAIIRLVRIRLERLGCRVEAFSDSTMALRRFLEAPGDFDLIITDQTMPRLTGSELSIAALRVRPGLPIILSSGFSDVIDPPQALALGIRLFLPKPYKLPDLVAAISSVTTEPDGRANPGTSTEF